jgi:hypothetical protein
LGATDHEREQGERSGLLTRAQAAHTPAEVGRMRQALRAWLERHPSDVEVLLADDRMSEPLGWSRWDT